MTIEPGPDAPRDADSATSVHPQTPPPGQMPWRAAGRRRVGGGLVLGLVLVLVGGYFLVRQAVPSIDADRLWPWGAIAIGVVLVIAAFVAPKD